MPHDDSEARPALASRHAAAWLAACASMAAIMVATARAPQELAENALFGLIGGTYAWTVLAVAERAVITRGSRQPLRPLARAGVIVALAAALVALTGLLLRKPFTGLMAIVGGALPLPLLALTARRHLVRWATAAIALGLAGLTLSGAPFDEHPLAIDASEPRPDDLVILSWNVGSGNPFPTSSLLEELPVLADVIVGVGADVACLQEIRGQAHLDRLLALLAERSGEGVWTGAVSADRVRVPAIVSRRGGRFAALDTSLTFSGPTHLTLDLDGRALEIVSLHLRARRHSRSRRNYVDHLLRHTEAAPHPVLLIGDFNLDPSGFWDRASPVLTDDIGRDRATVALLETHGRDIGAEAAATAVFSRRIDRAYLPSAIELVRFEILHGRRVGRMDHRPLLIRLRRR